MDFDTQEKIMNELAFCGSRVRELSGQLDDYIDELKEEIEQLRAKLIREQIKK